MMGKGGVKQIHFDTLSEDRKKASLLLRHKRYHHNWGNTIIQLF